MNGKAWLAVAGALQIAWSADVDPEALLAQVRSRALADAKQIPRYVCRQQIEQRSFFPTSKKPMLCPLLPETALKDPIAGRRLISTDESKLDVLLTERSELFSWPGGGRFDTDNPGDLLGAGISGSGDFASFRIGILINDRVEIRYQSRCGDSCLL